MNMVALVHGVLGLVVLVTGALAMMARKKKGSWHSWLGEIYHWAWLLMAITAMWAGSHRPGLSLFEIITPPSYAMALIGYLAVKQKKRFGKAWLARHIWGMCGSYIAVVTALGFQLLPRLIEGSLNNPLLFWAWAILPGYLGGKLLDRTIERWTGKGKAKAQPAPALAVSGD